MTVCLLCDAGTTDTSDFADALSGTVSIIRLSGPDAVGVAQRIFRHSGKKAAHWAPQTHRIYYGHILDGTGSVVDEVSADTST